MKEIDEILQGSIDMHVHNGPDANIDRRVDALQAALQAQEMGMRAIVLKSHDYPTAPVAYHVKQVVPDLEIFGSISLDLTVGGLNPHAVEASAGLDARVVWMPTFNSTCDMKRKNLPGGVPLLDENGKTVPALDEVLQVIKAHDMVVATGHISKPEVFAMVDRAKALGLQKIVITHPFLERWGAYLNLEEQQQMADKGAFLEYTFSITLPMHSRLDPMKIVEAVKLIGAEHCIMSTDLGQEWNMPPAEGMRMGIATMLKCGLSRQEIEIMIKENPAKLLGLE
ncbi:DUF6282 family protein [Chloroflexota bacterium]